MKCVDCEYFADIISPIHGAEYPSVWEAGEARCKKHDLYVEYISQKQLSRLTCVEGNKK